MELSALGPMKKFGDCSQVFFNDLTKPDTTLLLVID
jgi:hypothetical protein